MNNLKFEKTETGFYCNLTSIMETLNGNPVMSGRTFKHSLFKLGISHDMAKRLFRITQNYLNVIFLMENIPRNIALVTMLFLEINEKEYW